MAKERTLSIIKPDAVEKNHAGKIIDHLIGAGFAIKAMKQIHLSKSVAEGFYAVHAARPFFGELVEFMTRSPVIVMVLEAENAIQKYRDVIGATDPAQAADGTIRKLYGASKGENAMHGSDAVETAIAEISYFFAGSEVQPKALSAAWVAGESSRRAARCGMVSAACGTCRRCSAARRSAAARSTRCSPTCASRRRACPRPARG